SPRDEHSTHIKEPNAPDVVPCNHSSDSTPPDCGDTRNLNRRPVSVPMKSDGSARHFSFSLDLCNFRATRLAHPINLFIRYSYPFFGTNSAMITHPEVEVNPKCEVSIPHGYCAFKFATSFNLLKSTFWETPLLLEVLHRKKNGQEQSVGTARINLFQVLDAPSISHTVDKKQGMRQMSTCKVVVTSPEGYEIGEIYAVLTLIDFGRTTSLCDHHSNQSSVSYYPQVHSFIPNFDLPLLRQNGLTQDELLQAALELELWQERQREIFRAQLKDKEMQHLSVLTSEWKQRDMERELLLQRQLQECQKLEDKLKATLKDAELKEKQLSSQEAELSQKLRNMDKQKEQQQKETKNQIESIKMEYNELLAMERLNVRDLEQKNSSLMRQAELQQKLEATLASKQKYKIQWGQAVRQISLLQQKLHLMERLELAKKDEELSSLQQRILASEDKNAIQTNEEILEMAKIS
ncbi:centrosomal protein of 120 kDa-like, partial [Stegodyphus dumicola]|uniref:centrosomal protein of 120 kDa-like n=1 Tax=Stegodyphus dumicola TaxID=202533 RepID=UPI0015A86575